MKLRTHLVFTLGLLMLTDSFILRNLTESLSLSLVVSIFANSLIDGLGHREIHTPRGDIITRTPLTHTFPRSVAWGVLASLPVVFFYYYLYYSLGKLILIALLDGALAGPSHLMLDMFTEKGIYVKKNGRWRRFALAHFKYDNALANGLAAAVGLGLVYLAFLVSQ